MATQRQFRQGDGKVTILPDEEVLLNYICRECGRAYQTAIIGSSDPTVIDCDQERLCEPCEKKTIVANLLARGTSVPEEQLLTMTIDQLMALVSAPPKTT